MKKIISILLTVILLAFSVTALCACNDDESYKRMTVDTNPSVEFMLDSSNVVVSVNALNSDAEIVIAGEDFEGKDAEDAIELYISIVTDCGYINANAKASDNAVSITINGDGAEKLYKSVSKAVNGFFEKHNIQGAVTQAQALGKAALVKLAMECDLSLTKEAADAMSEQELLTVIHDYHKEVAELCTAALKESYYKAKAYRFTFAEKEETEKVIESMGNAYATVLAAYNDLLDAFRDSIDDINAVYYDNFVSPECDYQVKLNELKTKKAEVVKLRNEVYELPDGAEKTLKTVGLNAAESALAIAQTGLETVQLTAKGMFDAAANTMSAAVTALENFEANLPTEVKTALQGKAAAMQDAANAVKDNFFTEFETQYAAAIAKAEQDLLTIKNTMKANAK